MGTGRRHDDPNGGDKVPVKRESAEASGWYPLGSRKAGTMASRHHAVCANGDGYRHRPHAILQLKGLPGSWTDTVITGEATREQFKMGNGNGLNSGLLTV